MDFAPGRRRQPPGTLAALIIIAAIAACSSDGDTPLGLYSDRLQRSLDHAIDPAPRTMPPLPRSRELHIALEGDSIDLLDLFSLRQCELGVTIGKSNSSLGKLATDSQRLLLELEFLNRAPACIAALRDAGEAELAATLNDARVHKQEQLPARIWNATLGGSEFRAFWKRPMRLHDYPVATSGDVPDALAQLGGLIANWLGGDYGHGLEQLEPLLGRIRRGDGGSLLAALETQRRVLAAATLAVEARTGDRPICFRETPSPRGQIVDNVVRKFFAGEVQPWSVSISRRQDILAQRVRRLEAALASVAPRAYRDWTVQRDGLFASSRSAPRTHALALAELLESCGLRPGQS